MYHLIYVSSAVAPFNEEQLRQLLEVSHRNNSKCGVSGLLLYLDGNFIQVLEGEEREVLATYRRVAQDNRHEGLIVLMQGEISKREFDGWSMGFKKVDKEAGKDLEGYSDFLNKKSNTETRRSSALLLLDNFRNINR